MLLSTTNKYEDKIPFSGYFALAIGIPIGVLAMIVTLYKDIVSPFIFVVWTGTIVELLVFILAAFWIWDILWHLSVRKTMRNMIDISKERLAGPPKKYFEQEQLQFFEDFIFGAWRFWRIFFGIFIISALIILSLSFNDLIIIPMTEIILKTDSVLSILIFLFVVISEAWIWIKRHQLLVGVKTLEQLGQKYNMSARSNT